MFFILKKEEKQPKKQKLKNEELIKLSEQINYANWIKNDENIIISTNKNIKIIELDNRSKRNIFTLYEFKRKNNINNTSYNKRKSIVNFIDKNKLYSIQLPKQGLLPF